MKMNTVDRSDQILSTFNTQCKCLRWWKTLFFHLIDIAVVNSYILFLEHKANNPNDIKRPKGYSQCDFRDALVRQICGFDEYGDPPPPPSITQGGPWLHLLCLKLNICPVFLRFPFGLEELLLNIKN